MTTLVSLKENNKIYIGTDRRVTQTNSILQNPSNDNKIIIHKEMTIAFSGDNDFYVLAKMTVKRLELLPFKKSDDAIEIITEFIRKLDLQLNSFSGLSDVSDHKYGAEMIFYCRGKMFLVSYADRAFDGFNEINRHFYTTGSGCEGAKGMYFYLKSTEMKSVDIVRTILQRVPELDCYSGNGYELYEYDTDTFEFKKLESA